METETITLAQPWVYRTALTTVEYPAGTHDVLPLIAVAARADGAIAEKEQVDGDTDSPAKARKARTADKRQG